MADGYVASRKSKHERSDTQWQLRFESQSLPLLSALHNSRMTSLNATLRHGMMPPCSEKSAPSARSKNLMTPVWALSMMLRSAQMSGSATPVKIPPDQSIAAHASPADSHLVGAGIGGSVRQDADLFQIVRRKLPIAWNKMDLILAVQITTAISDVISLATVK